MKTISVRVTGKVQGVFYRRSTTEKATELGVRGWVKNEEDGSVSIVATGTDTQLDALLDWCHHGPERARVTAVEAKDIPTETFTGFVSKH